MNINDIITESQQKCPHCGGPLVEYSDLMEKKDACYYKVKASAKVWPSAYASGRLVQCRKKGAGNYGNKSESVAEGSKQISEYRDRMYQYIKSIVPGFPDYIVKDWLYANFARGATQGPNWSFDTIGKDIPNILKDMGLSVDTKWQLVPNMKFTMGMWEPKTLKRLQERAGGSSKSTDPNVHIPARDAERHATQAALAKQQGGVRKEPVILIKTPQGYELLEGWHRTIQHFHMYPNGYTGPAYVAVTQGQQGVLEQQLDEKCWDGYQQQGMKNKSGRQVPNCVPVTEELTTEQQFDMIEDMVEHLAETHGVDSEQIWEDFESVDDHELYETAAWRRKEGKSAKGGLNAKGVASYRRENPGSKLQTAVTTKPSKLKPGSKAAKRRKSFCARMGGVKGPMKKPNGKPTRKALALRKWNC